MESAGLLTGVITQNVDRLHHAAGSRQVVELHGALADVRCLTCGADEPRAELQARLLAANPGWLARARGELAGEAQGGVRPDGDAELSPETVAAFEVVACRALRRRAQAGGRLLRRHRPGGDPGAGLADARDAPRRCWWSARR